MIREIEKLVHSIKVTNKRQPRFATDNINLEIAGVHLSYSDITFFTRAGTFAIPIRSIRNVNTNNIDRVTRITTGHVIYRVIF